MNAVARTIMVALLAACQGVSGGAVELSWALRPASSDNPNKFIDCALNGGTTTALTAIRLVWTSADGETSSDSWNCTDNHGVTGFALAPGDTLLSVVPECGVHIAANPLTYTSPAPVVRAVHAGDTVSLGAVQLVLQVSSCDLQPCICH